VPYDQVSAGFEAVYTGETSPAPVQKSDMVSTLYSDEDGNLISRWCTIPWIFPNEQGQWKEDEWYDTVKHLRDMQGKLGPLTDDIRRIRAHITSLIPCDSGLSLVQSGPQPAGWTDWIVDTQSHGPHSAVQGQGRHS
jgi:hypothetical protein